MPIDRHSLEPLRIVGLCRSVGSFDGKGPSFRIEAVIDTNNGRPRILMWRDMTDLGKGITDMPMGN